MTASNNISGAYSSMGSLMNCTCFGDKPRRRACANTSADTSKAVIDEPYWENISVNSPVPHPISSTLRPYPRVACFAISSARLIARIFPAGESQPHANSVLLSESI